MSKLFIYYSNTGSGDAVAEYLKKSGVDVRKVTPNKELPKGFFFKMMSGGFQATRGKKAKLVDFDPSTDGYDEVIIGSPIWNARLSCPINTVLSTLDAKGKPISFILWSGGGTAPKAVERLSAEYPSSPVVILKEPKNDPSELDKIVY